MKGMVIMDINVNENLINKISQIDEGQNDILSNISLTFNLVRKQKHADNFYQANNVSLHPDIISWLKSNIIIFLRELKTTDEESEYFNVGNYNHEITQQDKIAKYDLSTSTDLLEKKDKLINTLHDPSSEFPDNSTNFQFVKLRYQQEHALLCLSQRKSKSKSKKKKATP